jgi:hypothetical protein
MANVGSLSKSEPLVDKDGKATQYLMRFLQEALGSGMSSVKFPVRSVNGQTGDVVLDLSSLATNGEFNWDAVNDTIKTLINRISQSFAYTDTVMRNHEGNDDAHPYIPREKSTFNSSKRTGGLSTYAITHPGAYQKGFTTGPWNGVSGLGGGGLLPYPAAGAAAGDFGPGRTVVISAFYNPFKCRVRGVGLPSPGGSGGGVGSGTDTECYAAQFSIYTARPTILTNNACIAGDYLGKAADTARTLSTGAPLYQVTITLAALDFAALGLQVGDSCGLVGGADSGTIVALGVNTFTYANTSFNNPVAGTYVFFRGRTLGAARWLGRQIWSSNAFNDDTNIALADPTFSNDTYMAAGWVRCVASNSLTSYYQSQVINGVKNPSISSDFTMQEGVHFLVTNMAAIGPAPAGVSFGQWLYQSVSLSLAENVGAFGWPSVRMRAFISNQMSLHGIPRTGATVVPYNELESKINMWQAVNSVVFSGITDATAIGLLDSFQVDSVFSDLPYTGFDDQFTQAGANFPYTPINTSYTPAALSAFNSTAQVVPFMVVTDVDK